MNKFFTRFDRVPVSVDFKEGSSLTHQDFKRQSDINYIVQHYVNTGSLPSYGKASFVKRNPMFGDFSAVSDFQTMQNTLKAREMAFAELPARVRAKFGNDPNNLLKAIESAPNASKEAIQELVDLGIFEKSALKRFTDGEAREASSSDKSADVKGASAAGTQLA